MISDYHSVGTAPNAVNGSCGKSFIVTVSVGTAEDRTALNVIPYEGESVELSVGMRCVNKLVPIIRRTRGAS